MLPGQFQLESQRNTLRTSHADSILTHETTLAGVTSLIAGVCLRERLCDSERELLDRLAAHDTLTFLILDNRYLHPDNVELVPIDQLEPTLHTGGDAVFSHRHHLSDELGRKARMIRTSRVGQINDLPLILGMMGPELPEFREKHDNHFSQLITLFRRVLQNTEPLLITLKRRLSQPDATIIVNRSSGRILALNAAAHDLVSLDGKDTVDEEYTQIKGMLLPLITKGKVAIENRQDGGLNVAIVSVTQQRSLGNVNCPPVAAGFLQSMRHKAVNISSVARHLSATLGHEPGHAISELLQIVLEESTELDRQLWRHQMLTEYQKLRKEKINPVTELRKVIENTSSLRFRNQICLLEELSQTLKTELPRQALQFLYEGILKLHAGSSANTEPTKVVVQSRPDSNTMTVRFSSENPPASGDAEHAEWTDYCERLADTMGIGLQHDFSPTTGNYQTVLTISA